jgi:hypothetical protein
MAAGGGGSSEQGGHGTTATTGAAGGSASGGAGPGSGGAGPGGGGGGTGGVGPGSGGAGGAGGGNSACPPLFDACTPCLSANCQATYCTCYNDAACTQLAFCFQQCTVGDQSCYQACETGNPDGISDFLLVENCGAGACASQCPGATTLSTCETCLFQSCATAMNACVADAGCHQIVNCIDQCQDDTCRQMCPNGHSMASQSLAAAVTQCSMASCSGSCP